MTNYEDLCGNCGEYVYRPTKRRWLDGITVHKGKCPCCKQESYIIPADDWRRACEGSANVEDWD
jgi:hypothetical protein